jgi:8-oxo-dGTP pyrophosphatase MutT (NUDIX family)
MASYDLACSGFSAVMDNVGRLPHLRDDKRGTAQPGKSSFFGGRREQGDTPLQSVARKIAEEIGITIPPEHFQYLVRFDIPHSENIAVFEKARISFARGINESAPDTAESEPLIVEAEEVAAFETTHVSCGRRGPPFPGLPQ